MHKYLATPGIRDHTSTINAEIDCFAQVECQVVSWVTKLRTWNPILYANHLHFSPIDVNINTIISMKSTDSLLACLIAVKLFTAILHAHIKVRSGG